MSPGAGDARRTRTRHGAIAFFVAALLAPADAAVADMRFTYDPARDALVRTWLAVNGGALVETYRQLHAHPELSFAEHATATRVARVLRETGYQTTTGVGGTGVVGVLRNGAGPTLLVRADMDALPVTEQTGLPYASRVTTTGPEGGRTGVMHACGHDVHVTTLLGLAKVLARHREAWGGTLVLIAQPAEEVGKGARRMLETHLFEQVPRPDLALALHVDAELPAGHVGAASGWATAHVDSVDITVFGRGGHGARPHRAVDPIVTASHLVTALQTIVSRRLDPQDPGVITVGAFHAGTKHNVIPDSAHLQLTVRSYTEAARRVLLDSIGQMANDVCLTFRCPKPPIVRLGDEHTPAAYNDPGFTAAALGLFREVFGAGAVAELRGTMAGEDFGRYAQVLAVPGLQFRLGAVDASAWQRAATGGATLPILHSSGFAPDASRTIDTGVRALGNLALAILRPATAPSGK